MNDGARAWTWVEHLRGGGTTRWREWAGAADVRTPDGPVPGTQRLELLRRLNELGPTPPVLADAVLGTSMLGRGQQELRLEGAGPVGRFGAPRVAPIEVPSSELRRVATGALADLALLATPSPGPRPRRPRWRRPHYRLVGDPLLVASYADQLTCQGRPPGGRDLDVLVLVAPLDVILADAWSHRVLEGGRIRWSPWVQRITGPARLPDHLDASLAAGRSAARRGRDCVHVVTTAAAVEELTGGELVTPWRLSHAALEAVRGASTMLHLAVPEDRQREVLDRVVVPWLRAADQVTDPAAPERRTPLVPASADDWLARQADRVRESLRVAGYPVHGDGGLDAVLPRARTTTVSAGAPRGATDGGAAGPSDDAVLAVLTTALHRAARAVPATRGGGG